MALPYLDFNPKGSGYYTIRQRRYRLLGVPVRLLALGAVDSRRRVPSRAELGVPRAIRTRARELNTGLCRLFALFGLRGLGNRGKIRRLKVSARRGRGDPGKNLYFRRPYFTPAWFLSEPNLTRVNGGAVRLAGTARRRGRSLL